MLAGEDALSGIIELSIRGEWRSVCDDLWDDNGARVACRALGLPNTSKQFVYTLTLLLISEYVLNCDDYTQMLQQVIVECLHRKKK